MQLLLGLSGLLRAAPVDVDDGDAAFDIFVTSLAAIRGICIISEGMLVILVHVIIVDLFNDLLYFLFKLLLKVLILRAKLILGGASLVITFDNYMIT